MSTQKTVLKFLKSHSIQASGFLKTDLEDSNWRALRFIAYAIENFGHLRNLPEIIAEIAKRQSRTAEDRVQYENRLTELLGIQFVHRTLKQQIKSVESRSLKVTSPNRIGDKSCDFLAHSGETHHYFEVKDYSKQTKESYDSEFFTPRLPCDFDDWFRNRLRDSFQKGANFLICRFPAWSSDSEKALSQKWISGFLPDVEGAGPNHYRATSPLPLPNFFRGVYLVKPLLWRLIELHHPQK